MSVGRPLDLEGTPLEGVGELAAANDHLRRYWPLVAALAVSKVLDSVSTVFALSTSPYTYETRAVARWMFETFGLVLGSALTVAVSVGVFVSLAFGAEWLFSRASILPGSDVAARAYPVAIYAAPIAWNLYLAVANVSLAV